MKFARIFAFALALVLALTSCGGELPDITDETAAEIITDEATDEATKAVSEENTEVIEEDTQASLSHAEPVVSITDIADAGLISCKQGDEVFDIAAAIVTNDVTSLEKLYLLDKGTLASWEDMVISDYKITRTDYDFAAPVYSLILEITVTESGVDLLPPGKYTVEIGDGYYFIGTTFKTSDGAFIRGEVPYNAVIGEVASFVDFAGGLDPDLQNGDCSNYVYAILYYYLSKCDTDTDGYFIATFEEFADFAEKHFGVTDTERFIDREYVEKNNDLIGEFAPDMLDITAYRSDGNTHYVTVDFFADPMMTVIARTFVYELLETEDGVIFADVTEAYNSGLEVLNYNYYSSRLWSDWQYEQ